MNRIGCLLVTLGLVSIIAPLFGYQSRLMTSAAESFGSSPAIISGVFIVIGFGLFILNIVSNRTLAKDGYQPWSPGRDKKPAGPGHLPLDEIIAKRPEALSEKSIRSLSPYFYQIRRRGMVGEDQEDILEDVARRAGVSKYEVALFFESTVKAFPDLGANGVDFQDALSAPSDSPDN